jgi:hypothetical protein
MVAGLFGLTEAAVTLNDSAARAARVFAMLSERFL